MNRLSRLRNTSGWAKPPLLALVLLVTLYCCAQGTQSNGNRPPQTANRNPQSAPQAQAANLVGPQDVINFLNQTIGWYRHLSVERELASEPTDILFLEDNRQLANQIVRLSFDFAHAQAEGFAKMPASQSTDQPGAVSYQGISDFANKAEQQVKSSQDDLESLRRRLETATGARRRTLQSAIDETQSELQLAQTRRDVTRSMLEFIRGNAVSGSGPNGFRAQIDELERTVPSLAKSSAGVTNSSAQATTPPAVSAAKKAEPSGILALITDLMAKSRKMHTLDSTLELTDQLAQTSKEIRQPIGASLRDMLKRGDQIANAPDSNDPAVLKQQKQQLDALTTEYKQRADSVLPLVKQRILLDLYKRSLQNWRTAVKDEYSTELKSLIIRLAILLFILAVVFAAAELWRRAIFRYIRDNRRRYQLLLFRRIALWFSIALIIAFAFATELGSLATFAGLLTAGVAVALQNVILSLAGYFYLIGRYGVRVGDRVQISGVTGEVVDIGLVRLHLMELGSGASDAQPTGRVVVFSNSVVFQPTSGLFKQIPGTNFVWHEITLTLAPASNYRQVEERLMGAVEKVFAGYREHMEKQRRHVEKTLASVTVESLAPQHRLRLTQTGLEVVIRYPVELENAARIDDRVARELLDAIEREPKLKLVGTGTPNIQPVAAEAAAAVRSIP